MRDSRFKIGLLAALLAGIPGELLSPGPSYSNRGGGDRSSFSAFQGKDYRGPNPREWRPGIPNPKLSRGQLRAEAECGQSNRRRRRPNTPSRKLRKAGAR